MTDQAITLLLQIPLAGVVVVVVIVFLKYVERLQSMMLSFMDEQAKTNREFLTAQREQFTTATKEVVEELKTTRLEVAELRGRIILHNEAEAPARKGRNDQ